jgi:5-methylcytosine-specific restriction endonuclease McrA
MLKSVHDDSELPPANEREVRCRSREAHPEEAKANGRMSQHKRRWQKHNQTEGEHYAWKDVERMLEEQEGCCIYCEVELQEYHVDHVVSLAKGGSNSAENLVIACPLCNLSKNDKSLEEWINRPTKEQSELWYADPTKGRSGRPKK